MEPDFIEILSWNDYGESHYLRGPKPAANLPADVISSEKYVNWMPHEPLLDLISYFNRWFKCGARPVIERSKAYLWYRSHPKDAVAKFDSLSAPDKASATSDNLYISILVSSKTQVRSMSIQSGNQTYRLNLEAYGTCEPKDSIILISVPFNSGETQAVEFYDRDETLLGSLNGVAIDAEPEYYNFNYWSGSIKFGEMV